MLPIPGLGLQGAGHIEGGQSHELSPKVGAYYTQVSAKSGDVRVNFKMAHLPSFQIIFSMCVQMKHL